jgi:hypothetical protein
MREHRFESKTQILAPLADPVANSFDAKLLTQRYQPFFVERLAALSLQDWLICPAACTDCALQLDILRHPV